MWTTAPAKAGDRVRVSGRGATALFTCGFDAGHYYLEGSPADVRLLTGHGGCVIEYNNPYECEVIHEEAEQPQASGVTERISVDAALLPDPLHAEVAAVVEAGLSPQHEAQLALF